MVDKVTVDELFDVTVDDFDVIFEDLAEVDDVFDVVAELFEVLRTAPLTTRS